jgi:hypothetical protein
MGAVKFQRKFPELHSLELNLPMVKEERVFKLFLPQQPDEAEEAENVDLSYKQINSFKMSCICEDWIRAGKSFTHLSQLFPNGDVLKS